jgi:hypothetical protein
MTTRKRASGNEGVGHAGSASKAVRPLWVNSQDLSEPRKCDDCGMLIMLPPGSGDKPPPLVSGPGCDRALASHAHYL